MLALPRRKGSRSTAVKQLANLSLLHFTPPTPLSRNLEILKWNFFFPRTESRNHESRSVKREARVSQVLSAKQRASAVQLGFCDSGVVPIRICDSVTSWARLLYCRSSTPLCVTGRGVISTFTIPIGMLRYRRCCSLEPHRRLGSTCPTCDSFHSIGGATIYFPSRSHRPSVVTHWVRKHV